MCSRKLLHTCTIQKDYFFFFFFFFFFVCIIYLFHDDLTCILDAGLKVMFRIWEKGYLVHKCAAIFLYFILNKVFVI
jgi:hypothetical protein